MTYALEAPLSRWSVERAPRRWTLADAVLALVCVVVLMEEIVANDEMTPRELLIPGAILTTVPLAWRKSSPAAVAILSSVGNLAMGLVSQGPFAPQLAIIPVLIALYSAASSTRGRTGVATGAITLLFMVAGYLATADGKVDDFWPWMLWGGAWLAGTLVRRRGDLAARLATKAAMLEVEADTIAADSAQRERDRIARELHDVVAHSVSVMVVQAGAARLRLGKPPGPTAAALEAIEQAGRQALSELRVMLGVLRDGPLDADQWLTPLPGLADVPDLVGRLRSTGLPVVLEMELADAGKLVPTPELDMPTSGLELATYRILQESLTNVVRHGGLVPTVVTLKVSNEVIELEVRSEAPKASGGPAAVPSEPGRGIVGMRERATAVGGTFVAGPEPDGGFLVRAVLPLNHVARLL